MVEKKKRKSHESRTLASGDILVRVVTHYQGGKPQRASRTFAKGTVKSDIEAWVQHVRDGGEYLKVPTLAELYKEFRANEVGRQSHYSIRNYDSQFRRIVEPGLPKKLHTITQKHVMRLLAKHEHYARSTLKHLLHLLRSMFGYAVRRGYMETNPAEGKFKLPRGRRPTVSVLTVEQFDKLLTLLDTKNETDVMIKTLALSGLRTGEVRALEPRHLQGNTILVEQAANNRYGELIISQPKTENSSRRVTVSEELINEMRALGNSPYVFDKGYTGLRKRLKKVLKEGGLPHVSPHGLRHTHCTYLLAKGVNVMAVSRRLGHHSAAFTLDRYGHYLPSMEDEVMKALEEMLGD